MVEVLNQADTSVLETDDVSLSLHNRDAPRLPFSAAGGVWSSSSVRSTLPCVPRNDAQHLQSEQNKSSGNRKNNAPTMYSSGFNTATPNKCQQTCEIKCIFVPSVHCIQIIHHPTGEHHPTNNRAAAPTYTILCTVTQLPPLQCTQSSTQLGPFWCR